mmetsp:Transcript_6082/g.9327  ORF Transcript_6082/g.9327 Transcript_6082/m.9327 type:complete len:87 (-) Transcript_6082:393-653(-)
MHTIKHFFLIQTPYGLLQFALWNPTIRPMGEKKIRKRTTKNVEIMVIRTTFQKLSPSLLRKEQQENHFLRLLDAGCSTPVVVSPLT